MNPYSGNCLIRLLLPLSWLMLLSACATPPAIQEEPPSWTVEFERPIKFQLLVNDSLLVVATTRHLYGLDPVEGKTRWRKRNTEVSRNDLVSTGEDGYLLVSDSAGGAFDDRDTNIIALDQQSGEIAWESNILAGKVLQAALSESREMLFYSKVRNAHGDDRGFMSGTFGRKGLGSGFEQQPQFGAINVSNGRMLWSRLFDESVRMGPSQAWSLDDSADWEYIRPFDLSLYHPPLLVESLLCLTYAGVHCYDEASGEPVWKDEFPVIENEMSRSYANPVVDGSNLIMSGGNRVRMYDIETGEMRWRSERFDIVPEIHAAPEIIYAQLGGRFFHLDKEKWKWDGKFGVMALDKNNGDTLWTFDDADDAITNLLVHGDEIWLADEDHLLALDRMDGSLQLKVDHDFDEPPVYVALNEENQIVLIGEGEASAFNILTGAQAWYVRHAPLGPGAWQRFSSGLLRASGNILKFGSFVLSHGVGLLPSLTVPLGAVDFKIINTKKIVSRAMGRSGRRMTYQSGFSGDWEGNQSLSGNYQYFVTKPKGVDHVALAVVNLSTGETERLIRMDSETPNVVIDEGNNRIYETFEQRLLALPLQPGESASIASTTKRSRPASVVQSD